MITQKINPNSAQVQRDYDRAHRKAFWHKVRAFLGHKCNNLLPTEQIMEALHDREFRSLGLKEVPLDRIVGSSGRYRDFDLSFLPLHQVTDDRWLSIARANQQGIDLPPPLLYQIGDAYFVEDGNHRISVAGALGRKSIEARVIEIDASHLPVDSSCTRLGFKIKNGSC
jgi:hypothetical protein